MIARLFGGAALAAILALGFQTWRLDGARDDLAAAEAGLEASGRTLAALDAQAKSNDAQAVKLRIDLAEARRLETVRARKIRDLTDENETLRAWRDTALPGELAGLLVRPDLSGANAYRAHLSDGDAVSSAPREPEK